MANLSDILSEVLPEAPGCPQPVAVNAIRKAAIEFCQRSYIWRQELDPIATEVGVAEYTVTAPAGTAIAQIWLYKNGVELPNPNEAQLYAELPGWRTNPGQVIGYLRLTPATVRVYYVPSEVESLDVKVALKPTPTATTLDDEIYNEWYEAIAFGALERLLKQPGKDWSNPPMAQHYMQEFDAKIGEATIKAAKSLGRGITYVTQPRFV